MSDNRLEALLDMYLFDPMTGKPLSHLILLC